jgi:Cu+-exporting ATPase
MSEIIPGQPVQRAIPLAFRTWIELALASTTVLWAGWPLFVRGWQSTVNRSLNMFTLIAMGVGVAYGYSLFAALFPLAFPASFRNPDGSVPLYFEAAAVITALVLLGQVLEIRARSRTSSANQGAVGARAQDGARNPPGWTRGGHPSGECHAWRSSTGEAGRESSR